MNLEQLQRPSGHSLAIFVSHIGYLLSIAVAFKRNLILEGFTFVFATTISLLYHLCDEKIACIGLDLDGWHFLDVYYTFYTVMTMALFICEMNKESQRIFTNFYTTLSAALVYSARFTVTANVILWSIPSGVLVYFLIKNKLAIGFSNRRALLEISLHLFLALACFVLANFGGFDSVGQRRYELYPTAPETDYYWLFHSGWHFFSALAIGTILQIKKANTKVA